jgi:hypothetical protein
MFVIVQKKLFLGMINLKISVARIMFMGVLICVSFSSCTKVGPDDPFISLRTRRARVSGKWKVANMTYNNMYKIRNLSLPGAMESFSTTTASANVVDGNCELAISSSNGQTLVTNEPIIYTFYFTRDGQCSAFINVNGDTLSQSYKWSFSDKKSSILLTSMPYSFFSFFTNNNSKFLGLQTFFEYELIELRNKKMVMRASSGDGFYNSSSANITLVQK